MHDRAVIFLGPSLTREVATRCLPGAAFMPPITRGALERFLDDPPAAVGIVDGEFYQRLAISPKEILPLLDAGVPVFGSSSMGALRAVELEAYGMVGVGKIFEQFRSGALDADDEVAMTFCPETLRPLSEPLVNMRVALGAACAHGVVSERDAASVLDAMKELYFPDRTVRRLLAEAARVLGAERSTALRNWWPRAPNAKAADAVALLRTASRCSPLRQTMSSDVRTEAGSHPRDPRTPRPVDYPCRSATIRVP